MAFLSVRFYHYFHFTRPAESWADWDKVRRNQLQSEQVNILTFARTHVINSLLQTSTLLEAWWHGDRYFKNITWNCHSWSNTSFMLEFDPLPFLSSVTGPSSQLICRYCPQKIGSSQLLIYSYYSCWCLRCTANIVPALVQCLHAIISPHLPHLASVSRLGCECECPRPIVTGYCESSVSRMRSRVPGVWVRGLMCAGPCWQPLT